MFIEPLALIILSSFTSEMFVLSCNVPLLKELLIQRKATPAINISPLTGQRLVDSFIFATPHASLSYATFNHRFTSSSISFSEVISKRWRIVN